MSPQLDIDEIGEEDRQQIMRLGLSDEQGKELIR